MMEEGVGNGLVEKRMVWFWERFGWSVEERGGEIFVREIEDLNKRLSRYLFKHIRRQNIWITD
jgi:DNA primase large subunit